MPAAESAVHRMREHLTLLRVPPEIPGIIDATTDKLAIAKGNAGLSDSKKEEVATALRRINDAINLFGKSDFGRMVYSALNLDKVYSDTERMI